MTVTCLAIGDPHFQINNVNETEELIAKVNVLAEQLCPTFIVILGDLLHTHEKIHTTPFNLANKFITSLAKKAPVYLIIGNHDYISNQQFLTSNHPFNAFKKVRNVTVCDRVIVRDIEEYKFVFCPYVPPERFEEALDTAEETWTDATCVFAHQEFYGCRFNPVMTSTEGDIWPDNYPLVVSGHIHNEQWLQDNIYYTGSSMQHAFGETANKTIAFITFPFKLNKIDLEMRRKKIVYSDIDNVDDLKLQKNTSTKLVIQGSPEDFKVFRKSERYKELQKKGVVISFTPKVAVSNKKTEKKNVLDILQELVKEENKYVKKAFQKLSVV